MHKGPDYDAELVRRWLENAKEISSLATSNDPRLYAKVQKFATKFGFDVNEVWDRVSGDDFMFQCQFAVDPKRQTMHQKMAAVWIQDNCPGIHSFRALPVSGKKAWYLDGAGVPKMGPTRGKSKSIDFTWEYGDLTWWASHKYIQQGGGHQRGSADELIALLKSWLAGNAPDNHVLVVLADGPYFTHIPNNQERSVMGELLHLVRDRRPLSFAIRTAELPGLMGGI